jgi:sugar-specific transcriptional regulator TrmB
MEKNDFKTLGFSEKEAEVYLALNRLGPTPASVLARLCGIKRTTIYDLLGSLLKTGVIRTLTKGSTTFYAVDDVQKILYNQKDRVKVAENLVAQLRREQASRQAVQVSHYQGQEGFRELYEDILRQKPKELLAWMNLEQFYKFIDPKREEEWTLERIQKKIPARLILQDTPFTRQFKKQDPRRFRETRLIPKDLPFESTCFLYNGIVTLLDPAEEINGITIKNDRLYQMYKQIFEMNWNYL